MILSTEVECDEAYVTAGHKGQPEVVKSKERQGRRRRLQGKAGRGTLEKDRPPVFGMLQRGGQVVINLLANVKQKTIEPLIKATIVPGTRVYTDEYSMYARLQSWGYGHKRVNHGRGKFARDDDGDGLCEVHVNTMEGVWSGLRNVLDRFKGSSQRFLHLRVARDEFLHNHGHLHWRQAFEAVLRCIFSTPGDYWRRMAHQHRRMPLTLCYR